MSARVVLRPRFGLVVYAIVAIACLLALVPLAVMGSWGDLAAVAPIPLVVLGVGYVVFVAPAVAFDDRAVDVRNPLRTITVPYGRITGSTTRRGFTLVTDDGAVSAWAAPPPDRLTAERIEPTTELRRDPRVRRDDDGRVAVSAAPGSPSGDAAVTLADRLRGDSLGDGPDAPITRAWNVANIAVMGAAIVAAVACAVLAPR
ncbi:MAG: hypothetical protein ACTH31_12385 [Pseudoclavibacter sp.]